RIDVVIAVDPNGARLERSGYAMGAADIAGPYRRCQSVGGVVALEHRVVLVLERNYRRHRAEDLLARDLHVVFDIGEDGWIDEEPLPAARLAAERGLRTFLLAHIKVALDPVVLLLRHQRSNHGAGIQGIPRLYFGSIASQVLYEPIMEIVLYKDPGAGAAHLARKHRETEQRGRDRVFEIRVGEDHVR